MESKLGIILGGSAIVLALTALGIVHFSTKKMDKKLEENEKEMKDTGRKMDIAVRELADKTDVEVKDEIVNRAIERAVARDVSKAVETAVRMTQAELRQEIDREVRREIQTQRDKTIDNVDRKLVEEVERLSREDIVNDVQRKITSMMIDRMDTDLSDIRDKYSRKLEKSMDDLTRRYREKMEDIIRDANWDRLGYKIYKI